MYNVSNDYLFALKQPYHSYALRGTIGTEDISDFNVLAGSLSVRKQCSEGSEVKIGSVYISELKCTFLNVLIPRNQWQGKEIKLWEGMVVNGEVEEVPIGVFTIADAIHTATGVQVTAYDFMEKLNKVFPTNATKGRPYSILTMICRGCAVTCGMTQAQVEALPNGTQELSLYTENDIETYRDALSWLAQTLGCFAYIDRSGKVRLKKYESTVVDEMGVFSRFKGCKYSDYVTRYTGLSVVEIEDGKTSYYSVTPDNGLTYNLGSNPFLQYGTDNVKKTMREAILTALQGIQYTPFEAEWSSLAVYDLGDVVQFPQGLGANSKGCVMSIEWKYNKSTKIKGFGSNPALASARSKEDKDITGLMSKTDKNGIQYYSYINAEAITVWEDQTEPIISIRFTTMDTTKVTWNAEILCAAATSDTVEVQAIYECNGEILEYKPTETWIDGKHILSLWMVIEVEPSTQYTWTLYLKALGGTIHIGAEEARAAVWGQGLVSIKDWDGYIDIQQDVEAVGLDDIAVASITDEAVASVQTPLSGEGEDTVTGIALDSIDVAPMSDIIILNKTSLYYDNMKWSDVYESTWGAIYDEHTW